MKPPFPYFGGKQTLAPVIADLLPAHGHYVEPYGGSLALLLAKKPSAMETVNDLDGDLVNYWRQCRDNLDELERVSLLTPHSRAEHVAAYEPTTDDLERARRVWVQLTQGRAAVRTSTGWRCYGKPVGSTGMPDYLAGYLKRLPPASARLHRVSLECRTALEVIADYGRHEEVLLYVDPPYLGATRNSGGYIHEMKSEDDHRALADALRGCKATVVLSGYASPLYDDDLYAGWYRHTFAASTGQGDTWENRTEVLWSNRPLGAQAPLFAMSLGAVL